MVPSVVSVLSSNASRSDDSGNSAISSSERRSCAIASASADRLSANSPAAFHACAASSVRPAFGEMMRQQLRLRRNKCRKMRNQCIGHTGMQHAATTVQQQRVRSFLNERVLERVRSCGHRATLVQQLCINETCQLFLQGRLVVLRCCENQVVVECASNHGANLRNLFRIAQSVKSREQGILQRFRHHHQMQQ